MSDNAVQRLKQLDEERAALTLRRQERSAGAGFIFQFQELNTLGFNYQACREYPVADT